MIRKRLKELDIKITELANYLQLSRTTMYKFIDLYDTDDKNGINRRVLRLFDYINENDLIDKRNVINYILTNLVSTKEMEDESKLLPMKIIRQYILENPASEKSRFIQDCCSKSSYDTIIHYMVEISSLMQKKRLNEEEKRLLEPYNQIVRIYTKNN